MPTKSNKSFFNSDFVKIRFIFCRKFIFNFQIIPSLVIKAPFISLYESIGFVSLRCQFILNSESFQRTQIVLMDNCNKYDRMIEPLEEIKEDKSD